MPWLGSTDTLNGENVVRVGFYFLDVFADVVEARICR